MSSLAYLGCYSGSTIAGANMLDAFKENELEENPNSILRFGDMVIKKIALKAPEGTTVTINGKKITLFTGLFELGYNMFDITSLVFDSAVNINVYYFF